jgi:rubrerythrin
MSGQLISRITDMIKSEEWNATSLEDASAKVSNVMVKALMAGIAYDSRKHAHLFRALVEMLKGEARPLTEGGYEMLGKTIAEHINVELKMMRDVEELIKVIGDERLKYVLRYILDDEKRHHALLLGLQEAVNRRELVTEFEWLNIVWKDVPFFF